MRLSVSRENPEDSLTFQRSIFACAAALLLASACSSSKQPPSSGTVRRPPARTRVVVETVTVRDPEIERRVARLELRVLEKEAQVEDLQKRLEDTQAEVVRAMSKLQTVASRAEAASGMAEAEVSLQSLRQPADIAQVRKLVQQSSAEFNKQNYGGALYLASQAKALVTLYRARLAPGTREVARPGETPFAVPVKLKVSSKGNVREGPGTSFPVAFSIDAGAVVSGLSYADEWVRITDDDGRSGWIFRNLVGKP